MIGLAQKRVFFKKTMGQFRPLYVYFRYCLDTISIIQIEKSRDGVLGIRTLGRRMVGADETTADHLDLIYNVDNTFPLHYPPF